MKLSSATGSSTVPYQAIVLFILLGLHRTLPLPYNKETKTCTDWPCNGDLRLVGGPKASEGRLEFYYDGKWGTICDNGWKEKNAMVACKQLGYRLGGKTKSCTPAPPQTERWFDMVSCNGYEKRLDGCPHGPWKVGHCIDFQDVGLACYTAEDVGTLLGRCPGRAEEGDIRLVGGGRRREGILQLNHDCEWGTVCAAGWYDKEAHNLAVVCRQLGRAPGVTVPAAPATYGRANGTIWTSWLDCSGSERYLLQCTNSGLGIEYCKSHNYDVGVRCGRLMKPPRRHPIASLPGVEEEDIDNAQIGIFD